MATIVKAPNLSPAVALSFRRPPSSYSPPSRVSAMIFPPTPFLTPSLSLKVTGMSTSFTCITKSGQRHGGAFGAQMNLFSRLARIIKSYLSGFLSALENPEKIMDQSVLEMSDDLIKIHQVTAQVLASHKQLESKYKAEQQSSDEWYRKAKLALEKGEEELAQEALKRRKSYAVNANALKAQLDQQKKAVDNLVSNARLLECKIEDAKSKKDTLKARAQSAKTFTKVTEMLGNVKTSSALYAFEKMEEKVIGMEAQAEALNQLLSDDLPEKFALLESSPIDDDLAQMKKEMFGSMMKGELPAGRPILFEDAELEKELN